MTILKDILVKIVEWFEIKKLGLYCQYAWNYGKDVEMNCYLNRLELVIVFIIIIVFYIFIKKWMKKK